MPDNQVILEFVATAEGLKPVAAQLLAIGQITQEQYNQFQKANQAQEQAAKKTLETEKQLAKATQNNTKEAKALSDQYRQLVETIAGGVINETIIQLAELGQETELTAKKFTSAKQELRELTTAITSGQLTGAELETATVRAAELTDQIKDVKDEIRQMASDTRGFDLVAEGVRGITAAFSVATAASALFGDENKDLQEALLKVQAAMALAQGAQELANIATNKGGIATKAYGFAVQAVDKIQKAFAISTAAMWGWIGIAIAAATALLTVFMTSSKKLQDDQIDFVQMLQEEYRKQREARAKGLEKDKELIKAAHDLDIKASEEKLAAAIKAGKGIQQAEVELSETKIKLWADELETFKKNVGFSTEAYLQYSIKKKEIDDKIVEEEAKIQSLLFEMRRKADNDREKAILDSLKVRDGVDDELENAIKKLASNTKISQETRTGLYKAIGLSSEQIAEEIAKGIQDAPQKIAGQEQQNNAFLASLTEAAIKNNEDLRRSIADTSIQIAQETTAAIFEVEANNRNTKYEQEIGAIERKKQKELENKELTELQKAAIEKKYNAEMAKIKAEQFEKEKQAKLAEAVINGALALTKLMTSTPPTIGVAPNPAYYLGLATIVAQTAIQTGLIAAQRAPAFAKGTKRAPSGLKWVGEEGPELINDGGGYAIIPNHDAMQIAAKWDIPSMPNWMTGLSVPVVSPEAKALKDTAIGIAMPVMDYNQMAKAFSKELKNNPQTHINIDKGGYSVYVMEKGRNVEILNNRYAA